MKLIVLNSNSEGNAYILKSDSGKMLLLELGVRFDEIKKATAFKISDVVGALVTHEHGDHSKGLSDALNAGINVWASSGTHKALNTSHHRARITANGHTFNIGDFKVKAFSAEHDAAEPLGFLINHTECGTILFLTDSYYVRYTFKDLNHIIIEANYCQDIIDERWTKGSQIKYLRDRVLESHMSLQTCKKTLLANDLSNVKNIVLIHLSDSNSDEARFKQEVQDATGKEVHVANAGFVLNLSIEPF